MSPVRAFLLATLMGLAPALFLIPPVSASASAEAVAAPTRGALSISPASPMVGEQITIKVSLRPKLARPVVLQRSTGGKWVRVAKKRTSRVGAFRFNARASITPGVVTKFRVRAPRVKVGGVRRSAVVSPVGSVGALAQTGTLTAASKVLAGTPYAVAATFSPARAGRAVALQQLIAGVWTTIDTGVESATGSVTFPVAATAGGTHSYRAMAATHRGASAMSTGAQDVLVQLPPNIATTSLAEAVVERNYIESLTTSDGRAGTWSVTGGSLPAGLHLDATLGTITGAPEGPASSRVITFTFTDIDGLTASRALRLNLWSTPLIATSILPDAVIGDSYAQTLATKDGRVGTWRIVTGALPAGLTLNPTSGVITGTPAGPVVRAVDALVQVRFTDESGFTDNRNVLLQVFARPVVSTTGLPDSVVGDAYDEKLRTTDSRPGTWAVSDGSLPIGLTLDPVSGTITGVPAGPAGTLAFTVSFADGDNLIDTADLKVRVLTKPTIATDLLPQAVVGGTYSATLVTGDARDGTWAVTAGALPAGLTLNTATGAIGGKPTGPAGTAHLEITFIDTNDLKTRTDLDLRVLTKPVIKTDSLPKAVVGDHYDLTLATLDGRDGTWTITAGSLPVGVTLNQATGAITGAPTGPASVATVEVRFTDQDGLRAYRQYDLPVLTMPSIATTTLPLAVVGQAYSKTLATDDGRTGEWALTGDLPAGLSLDAVTGELAGTPTGPEDSVGFMVSFTDADGLTDATQLSITVATTPHIATTKLAVAVIGANYNQPLSLQVGRAGRWAATGDLPAGLTLDEQTGQITGTPASPVSTGMVMFAFTDLDGLTTSVELELKVRTMPHITTTSLATGFVGESYTQIFETADGRTGTWEIAFGGLPAGLDLTPGGKITGTPTGPASTTLVVRFTDQDGLTDWVNHTLKIRANPTIITTLPAATIGVNYDQTLNNADNRPGTWNITPGLPPGLTLNPSTGAITGTPSGPTETRDLTITFTDNDNLTTTTELILKVREMPTITPDTPPNAFVGETYHHQVSTADGRPGTWSITGGNLTNGLALDPTAGAITGTPTGPTGQQSVTINFTDEDGRVAIHTTSITTYQRPMITNAGLPSGVIDQPYSAQLNTADGRAGTWSITNGTLPGGLVLDPATGAIGGNPTGPANPHNLTVRFTDNDGLTVTTDIVLVVAHAPWRMIGGYAGTTCGVGVDDSGWCWGNNDDGQVGDGTGTTAPQPVRLPGAWRTMATHYYVTCGIKTDDSAWCWGYNGWGSIGNGTFTNAVAPAQVLPGTSWTQLITSVFNTCGIQTDGSAWCWGRNDFGQVGANSGTSWIVSPQHVAPGTTWKSISRVSTFTTCGTQSDDSRWCWGDGYGSVPVQVS